MELINSLYHYLKNEWHFDHSVAEYKISTGKKVLDTERENAKLAAITKMVQNPENAPCNQ